MAKHECAGMRGEIGFVEGQDRADESQVLIVAEVGAGRDVVAIYRYSEGGLIAEQAEEDDIVVIDCVLDPGRVAIAPRVPGRRQ